MGIHNWKFIDIGILDNRNLGTLQVLCKEYQRLKAIQDSIVEESACGEGLAASFGCREDGREAW